jgi:hypothetical protein
MFDDSVNMAAESIINGSAVTGSPGQPVKDDVLRNSWVTEKLTPTHATITVPGSAPASDWVMQNEDGIARPGGGVYNLISPVGGRFSIAKTVAGFGRIVDAAVAKQGQALAGGGND